MVAILHIYCCAQFVCAQEDANMGSVNLLTFWYKRYRPMCLNIDTHLKSKEDQR